MLRDGVSVGGVEGDEGSEDRRTGTWWRDEWRVWRRTLDIG